MRKTIEDLYEEFGNEAADEMIAVYRVFRNTQAKFNEKGSFGEAWKEWPAFIDVEEKWLAFSKVCEKYNQERNFVAVCIMSTTVADAM